METLTLDEMIGAEHECSNPYRDHEGSECPGNTQTPRIYAACLASYNSGVLHGTWIPATDADEMREAIAAMLRQSPYPNVLVDCPNEDDISGPCSVCAGGMLVYITHSKGEHRRMASAEEYAIQDYDGFGELSRQLGEYPDLETVAMHARMIDLHGEAWFAYCEWNFGYPTEDDFEERYRGEYASPEAYAEEFVSEVYYEDIQRAPFLAGYIDYEAIARDMQLGGDNYFAERGGTCYVFDAH